MSRDTEYQTLRTEILDKSGRQFNMVSFALTVTVALIGYGLTNGNALIFLVPLLMLALILIHLVRNIYALLRITSYIRLFIEPEEKDLKWETYMLQFRTQERNRSTSFPSSILCPHMNWCFLSLAGFALFWRFSMPKAINSWCPLSLLSSGCCSRS